jgi:hypothetical protein
MTYDQPIKPMEQQLDAGLLVRVLRTVPDGGDTTNKLQPYGSSPMTGRPLIGKDVATVMGFEGGFGISVAHASEKYGKKGTLLRRKLQIDKKPWPNGQDDMRLRITISYGHGIGAHNLAAPDKVYIRKWKRNEPFQETFESGTAPSDDFLGAHGFGASSGSVRVKLEPRGVGPGNPLVWDDENPLSETYTTCFWDDPNFSAGVTYIAMVPPYIRSFPLPNPQWIKHRLNFSDGFIAVKYTDGDPLGLVMGIIASVEAIGWDTGWHDLEGWHAATVDDPYQIPKPNSYEYPNYPISDPFNPVGEGVG